MPIAILLLIAALLAGCASTHPRPEIVAYVAGWKTPIEIDARQLTVVNYAFLDICWGGRHGNPSGGKLKPCTDADGRPADPADGSVVIEDASVDPAYLASLSRLKAAHPHLKIIPAVGGWTRSNRFSDMAADPRARSAFIASAIALLRKHRFDGLDIDWEYPGVPGHPCAPGDTCVRAADKANFVALARELRSALDAAGAADARRYLITIAAGSERSFVFDGESSAWLVDLARHLDWINLMTYDYHGLWQKTSGFVAPLRTDPADPAPGSADASVSLFLAQGIPASKITLGLPFYGKGWAGCPPGPRGDGLYQACSGPAGAAEDGSFEFATLTELGYLVRSAEGRYSSAGAGFTRHWHAIARVPYLYNAATQVFISYDDEASIHEKNRYAIDRGLRGVMFWELNADRHQVLRTVVSDDLPR